jgi:hypothetical protein
MSDEGSGSRISEEEEFREEEEGGSDEEEEESDEDDVPLSSLKKGNNTQSNNSPRRASSSSTGGRAAAAKVTSYAEDDDDDDGDDDSDDDDDKPLASLLKVKPNKATADAKKKSDKAKESSSSKKKKKTKDEPPSSPKKKKAKKEAVVSIPSTTSSSGNNKYEWSSAALYGTECDKGMLIQRLLCRWWYVSRNQKKRAAWPTGFRTRSTAGARRWTCSSHRWIARLDVLRRYATEWPAQSSLPASPPKNYDALDGFPGVYIGTSGEDVGTLLDLRDKSQAPSFANYLTMSASGLKELLVKALQEQRRQLLEAEGPGTPTERDIDQMLKWASKVNADKADKEAAKVLMAHGFN